MTRIWRVASVSLHLTGRPACERAWALIRRLLRSVGIPRTYVHTSVSAEGGETYVWTYLESLQRVPDLPTSLLRNRWTPRHGPNGHSHFLVGNGRRETRVTCSLARRGEGHGTDRIRGHTPGPAVHSIAAKAPDHSRTPRPLRPALLIYRFSLDHATLHFWPKPSGAVVPWRCSPHAHWALPQVWHGLNIEPSLV